MAGPHSKPPLRYVPDVGIPAMALILMIWLLASWANNLQNVVSPPTPKLDANRGKARIRRCRESLRQLRLEPGA